MICRTKPKDGHCHAKRHSLGGAVGCIDRELVVRLRSSILQISAVSVDGSDILFFV